MILHTPSNWPFRRRAMACDIVQTKSRDNNFQKKVIVVVAIWHLPQAKQSRVLIYVL